MAINTFDRGELKACGLLASSPLGDLPGAFTLGVVEVQKDALVLRVLLEEPIAQEECFIKTSRPGPLDDDVQATWVSPTRIDLAFLNDASATFLFVYRMPRAAVPGQVVGP